ncbi:hypothetical protein [Vibrio hepatarius]|uniref:hypothetical protein n=1 Tax=Vibrio hepatarius TaxID=171383 RepID=UPI003735ED3D
MEFSDFLKKVILANTSRRELLTGLQLKYVEFNGLDEITLSRWVNGNTSPSLYRQLLIADFVDEMPFYLDSCMTPMPSGKAIRQFEQYSEQFDSVYHRIRNPNCGDSLYFLREENTKCRYLFSYVFQFSTLKALQEKLDMAGIGIELNVFYIGQKNCAESCLFFHDSAGEVLSTAGVDFDARNSVLFGVSFFKNSDHCEIISSFAFNHLLRNFFDRKKIIFTVRGSAGMQYFEKIGGELIASKKNHELGNLYLYSFETEKLFSNVIVLTLIKQHNRSYKKYFERLSSSGVSLGTLKLGF